jgi:hypothetical protein
MINFIQSNQNAVKLENNEPIIYIIDTNVWENIISMILKKENIEITKKFIHKISMEYNIDKKNIINDLLSYIIHNHSNYVSNKFLDFVENLMHSQIQNNNILVIYALSRLYSFITV